MELVSSLFIILFPFSAVSLVMMGQTEQSPWSNVAVAPVLGEGGGAVLVHLPIEAERYESGLAIVRTEETLAVSPTRATTIPVDIRTVEPARAMDAPPSASVVEPRAIVAARRITAVDEVTPTDALEPVVTRSGNPIMLMAAKP